MSELANNRKAFHDYEILEKLEAGLVLSGQEVKSIKKGHASLKGSFITFRGDTPILTNANISKYQPAGNLPDYDPLRPRPLLLHKKQIAYLKSKVHEEGLTIIPISMYTKNHLVKIEVAVAKGKKKFDKRAAIKKRDLDREVKRTLKT
ncbi:MAG: SsrA-binding protein SmpB [Candidatus Magasanikbacteria bacterium]